jgi:hypothetical protein
MRDGISEQEVLGSVGFVERNSHSGEELRSRRFGNLLACGLGLAFVLGVVGCHKTTAQGTSYNAAERDGADPANVNMAPGYGDYATGQPSQGMGQSARNEAQQQAEEYSQQPPAPVEQRVQYSAAQSYNNQGNYDPGYNNQSYAAPGYNDQYGLSDDEAAQVYDSDLTDEQASEPPPPLLVYDQPPAPDPDYLWTPGYWAWGPYGYYWVPGCWVAAPYTGALWTPGYWGYYGGQYRFHRGFWGLHIGFYGGINYGFGYFGTGYYGGYWDHDHFRYNTAVNRIDRGRIRYVYAHPVPANYRNINVRVSYNGGRGGLQARPQPAEVAVLHERRIAPMQSQVQVQREASQNRQQSFSQNRGRPAMVAVPRPVVADRQLPAQLPRAAGPVPQAGFRGGRQGQDQGRTPGFTSSPAAAPPGRNAPEVARPNQDMRQVPQNWQNQPGRTDQQTRSVQPNVQPAPQQQLQQRPVRQPDVTPVQPNVHPQPAPQVRPVPEARPQEQPRPQQMRQPEQARPQQQLRQDVPRPPQPQAQPQAHPAPPPQAQLQARPAQQSQPQHGQPQPQHGEHKDDGKDHK